MFWSFTERVDESRGEHNSATFDLRAKSSPSASLIVKVDRLQGENKRLRAQKKRKT
nr:MAG TPA: hypothetical protein [Caudoviricetes sp.]